MKDPNLHEKDQWIPWEVSYSLREQRREGRVSKTNAMLAVVIPDENGSYEYFITAHPECEAETFHIEKLFGILRSNMFNRKRKELYMRDCGNLRVQEGSHSYIYTVRWNQFITNINGCVSIAVDRQLRQDDYDIVKTV